mmetsp:Transcript_6963/g.12872  ORF Transcript_6963/g.12872 Transcript_6963/m.12872 type:complete len:347 (-) Transcript_6963:158-1198(-)
MGLRSWWTGSSRAQLLGAQEELTRTLVRQPMISSEAVLNSIDTGKLRDGRAIVLAHGFGSGLGFFFANIDGLAEHPSVGRVACVDWMGMGGSERPGCWKSPRSSILPWCSSPDVTTKAVDFFIDPMEEWFEHHGLEQVTLVGHSLGGYLSAMFAAKYPHRVHTLVLASPVGFAPIPENSMSFREMPTTIKIIRMMWSLNVTPQQLVRTMGQKRGTNMVFRGLKARIPSLTEDQTKTVAEYLYHITVAPASGEYALKPMLDPYLIPDEIGVGATEVLDAALIEKLKGSKVRVLFGSHDWMRPQETHARKVLAKHSDAKVQIVPDAGHHLYLDNTSSFNEHVLDAHQF